MVSNSTLDQLSNVAYGQINTAHTLNGVATQTLDKVAYGVIITGIENRGGAEPPATVNNFFNMFLFWTAT